MLNFKTRKKIKNYEKELIALYQELKNIPVEQVYIFRENYLKANEISSQKHQEMLDYCSQEVPLLDRLAFHKKFDKASKKVDSYFYKLLNEREALSTQKIVDGTYDHSAIIIPFEYLKRK